MPQVFLATSKGDDPLRIEEMRQQLRERIPTDVEVIDGLADWQEHFHRCGGWNGWVDDVACGRTLGGRARFDAVVCPYSVVGRATAQIVERALGIGKPVVHYARNGSVSRVTGVECVDFDSWKAGWELVMESRTR